MAGGFNAQPELDENEGASQLLSIDNTINREALLSILITRAISPKSSYIRSDAAALSSCIRSPEIKMFWRATFRRKYH